MEKCKGLTIRYNPENDNTGEVIKLRRHYATAPQRIICNDAEFIPLDHAVEVLAAALYSMEAGHDYLISEIDLETWSEVNRKYSYNDLDKYLNKAKELLK